MSLPETLTSPGVTVDDLAKLPPTITVPQAAEILGCSADALYAAIREGDAPVKALRIGRKIVVATAPLLEQLGVSA